MHALHHAFTVVGCMLVWTEVVKHTPFAFAHFKVSREIAMQAAYSTLLWILTISAFTCALRTQCISSAGAVALHYPV